MPYGSLAELPQGIRNVLPKVAQDIWRRSYNKGRAAATKAGKRDKERETQARQWAWQAVKAAGYVKDEKAGKWKLSKTAKKGVQAAAERSYPAPHKGRPGQVGGSLPRDGGAPDKAIAKWSDYHKSGHTSVLKTMTDGDGDLVGLGDLVNFEAGLNNTEGQGVLVGIERSLTTTLKGKPQHNAIVGPEGGPAMTTWHRQAAPMDGYVGKVVLVIPSKLWSAAAERSGQESVSLYFSSKPQGRSYPAPHKGRPGQIGGSAPRDGGLSQTEDNLVTPIQRKEILRHLTARATFLRGKIVIQWVEPVQKPKKTQMIHVLATVESTAGTVRKWDVDDIPKLVRHPYSIGNLSMRISKPARRKRDPPLVVKFDW